MHEQFIPQKIWHYTSLHALQSILLENQLWLTDFRFMNDPSEFSYSEKLFFTAAKQKGYKKFEDFSATQRMLLDNFRMVKTPNNYDELLEKAPTLVKKIKTARSISPYYIMSFCEDGDLLTQWLGYSNPEGGCAICFDAKKLLDSISTQNLFIGDSKHKHLPCIYDEHLSLKNFLTIMNQEPKNKNLFCSARYLRYITLCRLIKHPAYEHEKEWRLILKRTAKCKLGFNTGKPHLIINIPNIINTISTINLSPHGNTRLNYLFVEELLNYLVKDDNVIPIHISRIPYRVGSVSKPT